jgi:hypothetical protein
MAGEFGGQVGEAYVRIRADLRGLPQEINSGVKRAFSGVGEFSSPGLGRVGAQLREVGVDAQRAGDQVVTASRRVRTATEQAARDSVAAELRQRRALQEQVVAYREVAVAAVKGSETQVAANRLAAQSAQALGLELTIVEKRALSAGLSINALERGAIAGSGALRGLGRNVAFASLGFIGAYGLVGFIRQAIEGVSELNNQTVRSVTVFGNEAGAIQKFAKGATHELSLADQTALQMADDFGTVFRASQISAAQTRSFSEDLVKVAAAISLARGEADPERAEQALRVALVGRGRALRQYGIVLDQTSVKQEAVRLGLVPVDQAAVALGTRKLAEARAELLGVQAKFPANSVQVARAQDAVTVAQKNLDQATSGSTGTITRQATAIAAHSLIMQQAARYTSRYGDSLDTAAGRSRQFHESVDQLKDDIGTALYPAFVKAVSGIDAYLLSIEEGGSRHDQFENDLHDLERAANSFYQGIRLVAIGVDRVSTTLGGFGNTLEILGLSFAATKLFKVAAGFTATATEAELAAGKVGGVGLALSRIPAFVPIAIVVTLEYELLKHKGGIDDFLTNLRDEVGRHVREPILKYTGFSALTGIHDESYYRPGSNTGGSRQKAGPRYKEIRDQGNSPGSARGIMRGEGWTQSEIQSAEALYATTSGHGLTIQGGPDPEGVHPLLHGRDPERARADATAAAKAGRDTGQAYTSSLVSSLKSGLAQTRSSLADINRQISEAASDNARAMADAVHQAVEAERAAVLSAKQSLNQLGGDLADRINQLLDKQGERAATAPTGPLAKRLAHLEQLIHAGQATPALIREAQRVEHELNAQGSVLQDDAEKRKERITRRLADLTDLFNQGRIGLGEFNKDVTRLLRSEGVSYKAAGQALGIAFADGFRASLTGLREQARAIAQTPAALRRTSTGLEANIVRPLDTIREQNRNIANVAESQRRQMTDLIRRRHELLLTEQRQAHQLARAQGKRIVDAIEGATPAAGAAQGSAGGLRRGATPSSGASARPEVGLLQDLISEVRLARERATNERRTLVRQERRTTDAVSSATAGAHDQRAILIHNSRSQTSLLTKIERHTDRSTSTLRDVERELRKKKTRKPPGTETADKARQAGVHNLV